MNVTLSAGQWMLCIIAGIAVGNFLLGLAVWAVCASAKKEPDTD